MLAGRPRLDWESVSVDQAYLFVCYGDTELEDRSGGLTARNRVAVGRCARARSPRKRLGSSIADSLEHSDFYRSQVVRPGEYHSMTIRIAGSHHLLNEPSPVFSLDAGASGLDLGWPQDCSFSSWRLIKLSACSASVGPSGLNLMAVPLLGTITRSAHTSA
jgi:hypothetical protein